MSYSDEELHDAKLAIAKAEKDSKKADVKRLGEMLEKHFLDILVNHFEVEPVEDDWLCTETLAEVAFQAVSSTNDFRHRYPHSVTAIKYISIVAFWINKLKPINGLALKQDGEWVSCPNVNERVALRWIEATLWRLFKENRIQEFLPFNSDTESSVKKIFNLYFYGDTYISELLEGDARNNKSYESAYYMRYKKMTAINIYESLIHMLLPIRHGFSA